jgi:hypothetical protein
MKNTLVILSALFLIVSCGKYEKPFITFKSPEKRLLDTKWKVDKIVKADLTEETPNETLTFKVEGSDSIFVRTIDTLSYTGTWKWLPALDGELDKQRIVTSISIPQVTPTQVIYEVKVLKNKELEMIDMNSGQRGGGRYFCSKN